MVNIQEIIGKVCPEAVFEENEVALAVVPDAKWHTVAETLKKAGYDWLACVVGEDWGDALGCTYYIKSTSDYSMVSVKVTTTDRENPMLHSVYDVWEIARLEEREVYDFYGIKFINHPDMRRLYLRNDWVGFPLRKDYDENLEINPIRLYHEKTDDTTVTYVEDAEGNVTEKTATIFSPEEFVVNIGPQHPATHGVLRFRTSLDGEEVKKIDLYCGYIHRGVEKLCEKLTYPQTIHFYDRMDYFSALPNEHCVCACIEKALGIEVPRRAQVIRVMVDELSRIASHLLFFGTYCMDLGATTALFYGMRERETILDILEATTGARMSFNYNTIGGVRADLYPTFQEKVKEFLAIMPERLKEYHQLVTGNIIFQNRLKGVGVLSKEDAVDYGVAGPSGRASGWACDLRKTNPYSIYSELDFEQVVLDGCDSFDRYLVRLKEIEQSCKILEQLVDNIPEGDYCAKVPKIIKLPEGHWYQEVEACRGIFGVYIDSKGEKSPYRMKVNGTCLRLAGVVDHLTRGEKIADLITIGGSLDYVVPEIDR
ncbi:MAG: NADH-quinone oxidoreductase subunit D [Muribaculaceae bacterium]|nr:NADH-quinone oxidoreductase subunit D [Muribaculaceae bacterium]